MGLDIGQALREGASRTAGTHGLILAAVFAGIALLTAILLNTLLLRVAEFGLEFLQAASPSEMGLTQQQYQEQLQASEEVTATLSESLTIGVPLGVAAGAVIVTALLAETVSIVAVRVFATDEAEPISRSLLTENIVLATLNGFVGGIVVLILVFLGLILLIIPGIVLAVLFYFLRQEIAIEDKNFVQAMADSWRLTRGHRIEVFIIGAILLVVSQLEQVSAAAVGVVSTTGGIVAAAAVGGLLSAFGAAVVTRAYVQINDGTDEPAAPDSEDEEDPYNAALGPEDLTR
jgi:hypothetical protein